MKNILKTTIIFLAFFSVAFISSEVKAVDCYEYCNTISGSCAGLFDCDGVCSYVDGGGNLMRGVCDTIELSAPTGLKPVDKTTVFIGDDVLLNWNNVKGASAYKVEGGGNTLEVVKGLSLSFYINHRGHLYWRVGACADSTCSQTDKIVWSGIQEIIAVEKETVENTETDNSSEGSSGSVEESNTKSEVFEGFIQNPLNVDSFEDLLDALTNFIFWVGITIAPIMLIIAGFIYITAAGDSNRITTARNWIIWTLAGLAVILLARGLVLVIQSFLVEVK